MNIKQSTLAAAVTAALAMGMSSQAAAYVYGGSALDIDNFTVVLTGVGPGTEITSFAFTTTNTATLNGVSASPQSESCGGIPGAPGALTNDCNTTVPRLDALAANAPGGTVVRANNDFSLFGPGGNEYANSDSVIWTAELTGDATARTQQIAESELQATGSGNSNAEITSNTGFVMVFVVDGTGQLVIDFDADPYMRAAILDPLFLTGNAQGNINFSIALTNLDTGDQISWAPQGTATVNDCSVDAGLVGVTCVEDNDGQDLNRNISTSANNTNLPFSAAVGFSDFGITVSNLIGGNWNLAFNAVTSSSVRLTQQVPEPGVLALMGMGLIGMGVAARRRKKA